MDVLIKGYDMPKCCNDCAFHKKGNIIESIENGDVIYKIIIRCEICKAEDPYMSYKDADTKRRDDCPLVPACGVEEQSTNDYIKREDAIKAVNHLQKQLQLNVNELEFGIILKDVFRDVIPSADVEPVRHSVWRVASTDPDKEYECMRCKEAVGWKYLYCPNCGAKMDGKSNE